MTVLASIAVIFPSLVKPILTVVFVEWRRLPAKNSSSLDSSILTGLPVLFANRAEIEAVRVSSFPPNPPPIYEPITVISSNEMLREAAIFSLST